MLIPFMKFQGTGNDFVMIDNRELGLALSKRQIARICNRQFGVGADGLILIEMENFLPKMIYYNSDGADSSMCGNGGRCFVKYCHQLGIIEPQGSFIAIDGLHEFKIEGQLIHLKMSNVTDFTKEGDAWVIETGSRHYIEEADGLDGLDLIQRGRNIRYSSKFEKEGVNVNIVETDGLEALMRTYERGVENETLSCGTGATAVAIMLSEEKGWTSPIKISALGGKLEIVFEKTESIYQNVWLIGPAESSFEGTINV
jgi:diaminopimelate epimerase